MHENLGASHNNLLARRNPIKPKRPVPHLMHTGVQFLLVKGEEEQTHIPNDFYQPSSFDGKTSTSVHLERGIEKNQGDNNAHNTTYLYLGYEREAKATGRDRCIIHDTHTRLYLSSYNEEKD